VWSVKDAGTTGAVIAGNVLTATAAGTVTVTATIVNGQSASTAGTADYLQDFTITVSASMPDDSLGAALSWITANAVEGGKYTYTLRGDESIGPRNLGYSNKAVSITLVGDTGERTVSLSEDGSLFTVQSGVTLTLGQSVTLAGRANNTASLVRVENGGTLVMNAGSKIRGNTFSGSTTKGGGVYVDGAFTMNGGEISGNTAAGSYSAQGGGVYVEQNRTFTMNGGVISGNTAGTGGGVYVFYSRIIKSGGTIYGSDETDAALKNTATDNNGHAVFSASGLRKRNTTAGPDVALDNNTAGAAGGWE
jgi:hypothetical protein